ncbi:MAG: HlyD family secretion protein [Methylococcales bacterium]|jgi:multidrug efflux pump subunit AcrA (membrane-fusion protein)|nr:HlyD family secretion protein [Methylococcales bacterium]
MKNLLQKPFILPTIVILALALVIFKVKSKPPIEHQQLSFPTKTVEVITLKKIPFRSKAIAYGNIEPTILVTTKAEVSGKISYIHPQLKKGGILAKGTVALRIESTTFEFSLDQSKAGLVGSQSSLKQLEIEEQSTQNSLNLVRKNLQVGQAELERLRAIHKQGVVARSQVDTEEQKVLNLRQQVADLEGKLASYHSRKSVIKAQIKQSKTQLAQSKDTLTRTEILMPFNARIGAVSVEKDELVSTGSALFEALGIQSVEINAQMATRHFRPLLSSISHQMINLQNPANLQKVLSKMQLDVSVSLVGFESNGPTWQGKLSRIAESIDPTRDTIGLAVTINEPYQGVIPGKRPPLLRGMYVAVEFLAPRQKLLTLPRKALHQGRVYIAKPNGAKNGYQLDIRPVNILIKQGELVVIDDDTMEGEKIIITDVIPVINGLPVNPILATNIEKQLMLDAVGKKQ